MIKDAVDRYAAGAPHLAAAIRGLSDADLNAFPVPGMWSIRQVIVHLMDSDAVGVDRMKRVIAMENPLLMGYDENAYIKSLSYEHADLKSACEVFRLNREIMTGILRRLPESAFSRSGIHSERGRETLMDLVQGYVRHMEHHLKFVEQKREKLGK
jgi:uncharacterized damage-inducible protein DinB